MSVISGIVGSQSQKSAANTAADSSRYAAQQEAAIQKYMFDKLQSIQAPYNQTGLQGLSQLPGADPTAGAKQYQSQIENMQGLNLPDLNLPDLNLPQNLNLPNLNLDSFNFAFDPNDPTYKYRQGELTKTIDQAAAARGNYNSRPTINAQAQGNIALTADESQRQFGRALDTYNTNISTDLSQYGADYGRATDIYNADYGRSIDAYNAQYGKATDTYGADYGKATDIYNTGYGKLTDLYNISQNIGSTDYNKILDTIKIGQGAASSTGQGALATGQGLANTYGQLGSNLANTAIAKGQATSDLWGNIGTTNTVAALALLKKLKYL